MSLNFNSKIFVAGHKGMVGSAVIRLLKKNNYKNLLVRSKEELNLENRSDVLIFLNYINQNMFFYVLQKLEEYTQIIHTFLNFI